MAEQVIPSRIDLREKDKPIPVMKKRYYGQYRQIYSSNGPGTEKIGIQMRPIVFLKDHDNFVAKCFCTECNNISDINLPEEKRKDKSKDKSWTPSAQDLYDSCGGGCSACGARISKHGYAIIGTNSKDRDSWTIPASQLGRYMFEFTLGDGDERRVTAIRDNLLVSEPIIDSNYRVSRNVYELSQTIDFDSKSSTCMINKVVDDANGRKKRIPLTGSSYDDVDFMQYFSTQQVRENEKLRQTLPFTDLNCARKIDDVHRQESCRDLHSLFDAQNPLMSRLAPKDKNIPLTVEFVNVEDKKIKGSMRVPFSPFKGGEDFIDELLRKDYMYGDHSELPSEKTCSEFGINPAVLTNQEHILMDKSRRVIEVVTSTLPHTKDNPVYCDIVKNGLFLKDQHPGANNKYEPEDSALRTKYMSMFVRYPAAVDFAAELADNKTCDWQHDTARRHPEKVGEDGSLPKVPDSVKAKIFREQMHHVMAQLAASDDKVLDTIHKSKDADDMRKNLQFFVDGDPRKSKIPDRVRTEDVKSDPTEMTKKLKAKFNSDPIATASNCYTCSKLGIKDINHIMLMFDCTERNGGSDCNVSHASVEGVIAPVRTGIMMRFMRNYFNTRGTSLAIEDIYGSHENFSQTLEVARIYDKVMYNCDVANTPELAAFVAHEAKKESLSRYLDTHSVQDAYQDYILEYGDKTKKSIDRLVHEIRYDGMINAMKKDFDEKGVDFVMSEYPEMIKTFPVRKPGQSKDAIEKDRRAVETDARAYTSKFFESYEPYVKRERPMLACRNGKPLFGNRTIPELHDELSHLATKAVGENTPIPYKQWEKDLEADIPAPDGSGTWRVRLHNDTFEMIRTADELSNCLASHQDNALSKKMTYLYMTNEIEEKVACISVCRNREGQLMIDECEAHHDVAVHARYANTLKQWARDHHVVDGPKGELTAAGTGRIFHGNGNADFATQAIDDVTNTSVSRNELKDIVKLRKEAVANIYGDSIPDAEPVPDWYNPAKAVGAGDMAYANGLTAGDVKEDTVGMAL